MNMKVDKLIAMLMRNASDAFNCDRVLHFHHISHLFLRMNSLAQ